MGLNGGPFLEACSGRIPSRTPVWILRQAGRYLPEYRALRARFPGFLEFLADPSAAAEATCQPPRLIGVDAAILFSDILTVLPPMGFDLSFREGEGPRIGDPLRSGDGRTLPRFDPVAELPHVQEAVRRTRASLPGHVPLIGFAGAPWTLACYLVDGGGGRDFSRTRAWAHGAETEFVGHLERLADVVEDHLAAQAEAGCQALQIFESWASLLAPIDYRRLVLPSLSRLVRRTRERTGVPVLLYANGASTLLPVLRETEADVLAVDWRMSLAQARSTVGIRPLQGNFDPCLLHAPHEAIAERVREAAAEAGGGPWIANLGHGIQPDAPVAGLKALVDAVHALPPPAGAPAP